MMRKLAGLLLALAATGLPAHAKPAKPGSALMTEFLATPDFDLAAGAARRLVFDGLAPQVRRTRSGLFAVVVGPKPIVDPQAETRRLIEEQTPQPTRYAPSSDYGEALAWRRPAPVVASVEFQRGGRARVKDGDLHVELTHRKGPGGDMGAALIGRIGKTVVFETTPRVEAEGAPWGQLRLLRLDPARPRPVVVLSAFTGGMHCCLVTTLVSQTQDGRWVVTEGRMLDGDAYDYEDADGDGTFELTSFDNAFLYAFSSYNGSFSPPRVEKLVDGRLIDVTRRPAYRPFLRQSVQALEFGRSEDQWRWSGFLAGWVAAKSLLGDGRQAWARMEALAPEFPLMAEEICPDGSAEGCPDEAKRKLPFREGLARHLAKHGYPLDPAPRARGAGVTIATGVVATTLTGLCAAPTLWPSGAPPLRARVAETVGAVTLLRVEDGPAPVPVVAMGEGEGEAMSLAARPGETAAPRQGFPSAARDGSALAGSPMLDAGGAAIALLSAEGSPVPLAPVAARLGLAPAASGPPLTPDALAERLLAATVMIECPP